MADRCCSCGKTFVLKGKSYDRQSIASKVKVKSLNKSLKETLEEEFDVKFTPEQQKESRFLCTSCSWSVANIAKFRQAKTEAKKSFRDVSSSSKGYLAKKINIRSPYATPRKIKRPRTVSPKKADHASEEEVELKTSKSKPKSKVTASSVEVRRACRYFTARHYVKGIKVLLHRVGFRKALYEVYVETIRSEVSNLIKKKTTSFHGKKTLDEIKEFSWDNKIAELKENCPALNNALMGALTSKQSITFTGLSTRKAVSVIPTVGTLMSIIMYQLQPRRMNDLQELNAMQMWMAGCKREVFARFSHLGLCTGIKGVTASIDRIRQNFDQVVKSWKTKVADYLLLPSDVSTSATIPYDDSQDNSESQMSVESTSVSVQMSDEEQSPTLPAKQTEHEVMDDATQNTSAESSTKTDHEGKYGFSICFDNVNQKTTVRHQTKDRKNKMFNMVQAYAARDRIPSLHLSDAMPSHDDIKQIPLETFLPSAIDEIDLRSEMTTIVQRILCTHLAAFRDLKSEINWHLLHQYSRESSKKSTSIPIGVMDKDESRIADMITIMEEYHKYVPLKPTGDPLVLPLHADGLSCERGNDSQNARINAASPWQQLQGFFMNIQEWHKRCLLLQDVFDELYSGSSGREKGTLFHLKNYFNHRNVTANVKESFNYGEEFIEFCTEGYILLMALHMLKISSLNELPSGFPSAKEEQVLFMERLATEILDEVYSSSQEIVNKILGVQVELDAVAEYPFCICKTEVPGSDLVFCDNRNCPRGVWFHLDCMNMESDDVPDGKWYCSDDCKSSSITKKRKQKKKMTVAESMIDSKYNYTIRLIWRGLNQMVRRDAIRENDGKRMLLHWRFDMLQFYEKHHPKYLLIGQRLLAAVNGAVSERLKHTLIWNRTVNPNGGSGKNIAMDLQMEFFNKEYKESVKDAGGNLTEATIARYSQMLGVGRVLKRVYETQVSGLSRPMVHQKTVTDRQKDLQDFVKLLGKDELFVKKPGRKHATFSDIDENLFKNIVPTNFKARLQRHVKELAKQKQIVRQMQAE